MDIERKARELVTALMQDDPDEGESWEEMARRKVAAALTPPEGYVLVPVEPTEAMQVAGLLAWREATPAGLWSAMLAARPEVP